MVDNSHQQNFFNTDAPSGPVECLGMTFESDEARREYFLEILREKLKDPEFRQIEGFPIGEDEDILALSDPPYYTACPNPFLEQFIECYGKPYDPETDDYHREPFAADVSEGKKDPIYNAHSYHTKVPHKAIMRYILHYTEPGDIVLDGFCGTGMTGVAAQLCASRDAVQGLGYEITDQNPSVKLGARYSILSDISAAACFIARNYNHPEDPNIFQAWVDRIIEDLNEKFGWVYEADERKSRISYVIWSDIFICPNCSNEFVYWDAAVDTLQNKLYQTFACPHCKSEVSKRNLDHSYENVYDQDLLEVRKRAKKAPILLAYKKSGNKNDSTRDFSTFDEEILRRCSELPLKWHPSNPMLFKEGIWGDQWRKGYHSDVSHDHHFYLERPLKILSEFYNLSRNYLPGLFLLTGSLLGVTRLQRYSPGSGFPNMIRSGTLYIGSLHREWNAIDWIKGKSKSIKKLFQTIPDDKNAFVGTGSSSSLCFIKDDSVDYIFIDPPFGSNLAYSELNFLWEGWLKVFTSQDEEAIVSRTQNKRVDEYSHLMHKAFKEFFRVLKPGRWMTVEFHNSKNLIWSQIQQALEQSGFVVSDVSILDKKQRGFNAINSTAAVDKDLVISAYKPGQDLISEFELSSGTSEGVWNFINKHLEQIPKFIESDGQAEVIAERQNYLLFDRMVAFHVQRGVTVPLSASEFYAGLNQRFPQRDGMYFLPEQVAEYDRKRMTVKEVLQLELFVNDESTAVQWLRQQLTKKPQTFQELHPQFLKAIGGWAKHETTLELSDLLEQNYLRYGGDTIPKQIVSWLAKSSIHRARLVELLGAKSGDADTSLLDKVPDTGLETRDASLIAAAKDRWYIPDPNKEADLEKLRDRALLKEFEEYRNAKKKLKVFRMEAMRAGFKYYFQQRDYKTIIQVARKIPETILQEDPKLLMFYDNAVTRAGEG